MFTEIQLKSGLTAKLVMAKPTNRRLAHTCFRGKGKELAGNFWRWSKPKDLFRDSEVQKHFIPDIERVLARNLKGAQRLCITCKNNVGWASTAALRDYPDEELEGFWINDHTWGWRVKPTSAHLCAPQTNCITIAYSVKVEDNKPVVCIHSIYPGDDIGALYGDMTLREQVVFFDWEHPGAPRE